MSSEVPQNPQSQQSQQLTIPPQSGGGQLVTAQDDGDKMLTRWMCDAPDFVTNLPEDDMETAIVVGKAMSVADKKIRQVVGSRIAVVGFVVHPAELVDQESGEVTCKLRCVMLLSDGTTVSTMSAPCLRVLKVLARSRGPGRWNPPQEFDCKEFPLEGGKSFVTLNPVMPAREDKRKAK